MPIMITGVEILWSHLTNFIINRRIKLQKEKYSELTDENKEQNKSE